MSWHYGIDVSAGGLFAQRIKLNTIAENIANMKTTRTPAGGPYRRKEVIFRVVDDVAGLVEEKRVKLPLYVTHPAHIKESIKISEFAGKIKGVEADVVEDEKTPFNLIYDPSHPDANEEGYVKLPNVDIVKELTDMLIARRAYEANVAVISGSKAMVRSALEIGR